MPLTNIIIKINKHNNNQNNSQKNYYKSTVVEYNSKSFQNDLTVEVRSIPYIGRGVFTLQNISKGTYGMETK